MNDRIRTPLFIDPVAHSVERLCLILHRRRGIITAPTELKKLILFDMQHQGVAAPTSEECEALVECAIRGIKPEWLTDRYPRALIFLTNVLS